MMGVVFGYAGLLMGSTISRDFEERLDFSAGGEVRVKNVNGVISVEPWDEDAVLVLAKIEVKARHREDAEAFMERVEIIVERRGDRLSVEPDYPHTGGGDGVWGWLFGGGRKPRVKVDFLIRVPTLTHLALKSVNGPVRVRDIEGRAELGTTNGRIEAEGMRGSVDAHTTNGSLLVELEAFDRDEEMSLRTTNGGIKVYLPEGVEADIEASTVNGSISTDFSLDVRGKFIGKRVNGRINGGGGLIDLHTVNGSIRIYER
jgi:hypothetical protein